MSWVSFVSVTLFPSFGFAQVPHLINYQGRMVDGSGPVNGSTSLTVRMYATPAGGTPLYEDSNTVTIIDGLYDTLIGDQTNSGSLEAALQSPELYLEVAVGVSTLLPRERVTAVAYALVADGVKSNGVLAGMIAPGAISSAEIADGASLSEIVDDDGSGSGLDADLFDGQDSSAFATGTPIYVESDSASWRLAGNTGTAPGADFLGTTDLQPLEIRVNSERVARFEPSTNASGQIIPTVIFGHGSNLAAAGTAFGTTIGGGGTPTQPNRVEALFDTVSGGAGNRAAGGESVVSGGRRNSAAAFRSTVSGGFSNTIRSGSAAAAIGGGNDNIIEDDATNSVIAGGARNRIDSNAWFSVIGGGSENHLGSLFGYDFTHSVLGGGWQNDLGGSRSVIGGGDQNQMTYDAYQSVIGGGFSNSILTAQAAIGGGRENTIQLYASGATIAGGEGNTVLTNASAGVIGGGRGNRVGPDCNVPTIAGGSDNRIEGDANFGAIGGGLGNALGVSARGSVIGGGEYNDIRAHAQYAAVVGGFLNTNHGSYSTIAGGYENAIRTSFWTFVAGGHGNVIDSGSEYASIGGGRLNLVGSFVAGSVIAGGENNVITNAGGFSAIGGGSYNAILGSDRATIAGGSYNRMGPSSSHAAIGGGGANAIGQQADYATISGGTLNYVAYLATHATIGGGLTNAVDVGGVGSVIGGGQANLVSTNAAHAVIGGGERNIVAPGATHAVVGGGSGNEAGGIGSTVAGGFNNWAANTLSFAAGNRAIAAHVGSFVWGDASDEEIASTNDNSVTMRAVGGYRLLTDTNLASGAELPPGGGSWIALSDRSSKENLAPVDSDAILAKVAALPISTWNYRSQDDSIRHIGPMAQDFHAAFGVGERSTGITTIDADGVALAAIQALKRENEELQRRIQALEHALGR